MNNIVKIILLFTIIIVIEACDSNLNESNYYELSGFVYDRIYWDSSPYIRTNAAVVLDRDTVYTDLEGKYNFPKVKEGSHTIYLLSPNTPYSPFIIFKEIIIVKSNMNFNIELINNKEDYFPINSEFKCEFEYLTYNLGSYYFQYGKAYWKLTNIQPTEDRIVYEVEEKLLYNYTTNNWVTSKKDSSVSSFQIIEDNTNIITLKSLSPWNNLSFNRYNELNQGDTIVNKFGGASISIKKNVGIYKLSYNFSLWGIEYKLIE